jgi:hypothetical protein
MMICAKAGMKKATRQAMNWGWEFSIPLRM